MKKRGQIILFVMVCLFIRYGSNSFVQAAPLIKTLQFTCDGDFIISQAQPKISFQLNEDRKQVKIKIQNKEKKTIKTITKKQVKKNKRYEIEWDGKDQNQNYITPGEYSIQLTAGKKKRNSKALQAQERGDFSLGNGSKENPYQIASTAEFEKVALHNGRYFKQMADIDLKDKKISFPFSEENPFTGYYDGNHNSILNYTITDTKDTSLFPINKGVICNLKIVNFTSSTSGYAACLSSVNYGTIESCTVEGSDVTSSSIAGLLAAENRGTITDCITSGTVYSEGDAVGGIVGINKGKILNSTSTAIIKNGKNDYYTYTGGISGTNSGTIVSCKSSAVITTLGKNGAVGAIAGENTGSIEHCLNIGTTINESEELSLFGRGSGQVIE